MSKYKVTGREADKATLIEEEIRGPEAPIPTLREIIGKRQQPKGGKESKGSPHRKFFLECSQGAEKGYRYAEQAMVVYFPTKKAAKRVRNVLNRKHGSGHYRIIPLDLKTKQLEIDMKEDHMGEVMKFFPFGFVPGEGYTGD
jgi:hypothetical protein